ASLHQIRDLRSLLGPHRGHDKLAQRLAAQSCRTHQSGHTLASDTDAVRVRELRVDHRRAIGLAREPVDRGDLPRQCQILSLASAHRPIEPRVVPTPRDLKQPAHHPHRMGGLVHLHEPEERFEGPLSVANQAAAFARISRSSLSLRFSRRSWMSSSRSALVSPPSPLPASRAARRIHKPIVQAVGPNSFASEVAERPERCSSTIWRLNSGVYRVVVFAIVNPPNLTLRCPRKRVNSTYGCDSDHALWAQRASTRLTDRDGLDGLVSKTAHTTSVVL